MKVKEMIKENNRLREQMTPFNRSYLEDMILVLRASRVDSLRTEELLLEAAQQILQAQKKGKTATQVFGNDPQAYFKEVIESTPSRPARSKLNYYLMIPWTAFTLLFGIMAIVSFISEWTTGSTGMFSQISLFTLLSVGLGSIVFIEMIMKWMASLSDTDAPQVGKFDIKAFGVYIGIAVVVIYAGLYLSQLFPPFPISPWVSLIVSTAGLIGLKFIFLKK
ncbi:DUF1129 family protein [Paenibacillus wynnii]|uniref:DUF1129 family protein n=1 Tax=Paenibacillus wynnii TaxID=268407 RepID=UPI002791EEBA|nr:DUF1129 family protein [Paenibacillus wynnii]MDQ0195767.1 putative membrane-anchored protein [Paenibacillus wynnii]